MLQVKENHCVNLEAWDEYEYRMQKQEITSALRSWLPHPSGPTVANELGFVRTLNENSDGNNELNH